MRPRSQQEPFCCAGDLAVPEDLPTLEASSAPPSTTAASPPSPSPTASTSTASGPAPQPAIARTSGPDIVHGPRTRQEVALTFHGQGPASLTESVLRECAARDARITVFAVGQWVAAAPSLAQAIVKAGHELGNHTWSHQQMKQLDAAAAREEVARGVQALRAATGAVGWWFRPSGTHFSTPTIRAAAEHSGYRRCVSYDVDPEDFRDPGSTLVVSRTLAAVRPGSIVSLHLGHEGTVQALPAILDGLKAKGLEPVTLSRLLRDGA